MEQSACILIADDDAHIRATVKLVVEKAGYSTVVVENGFLAVQVCRERSVDLAVMDMIMPVMDGLEACRTIRQFSDMPVILLTARSDEDSIVSGFNAGAYDYLTKPFRPRELVARIKTLLERARPVLAVNAPISFADLMLDPRSRVITRGGEALNITAMGYQILEYLMRHNGEVVSKEDLLREVWASSDPVGGRNMVEAAIKRLRHELRDDPHQPKYIKTVWGVGYRFGG
jgi:DNA-binding response OmpR family regulator